MYCCSFSLQAVETLANMFGNSFTFSSTCIQGGQSRGQHDGVHRFPETVKSFITFLILSQISCDKVQRPPHIFLHKTVSTLLLGLL